MKSLHSIRVLSESKKKHLGVSYFGIEIMMNIMGLSGVDKSVVEE
jgi:hypothetical protein